MSEPGRFPTEAPEEEVQRTGTTIAVVSAALVSLGASTASPVALLLGIIGLIAAIYEFIAIYTDKIPTITDLVKRNGWPARIAVVVIAVLAFLDHFITGVIL